MKKNNVLSFAIAAAIAVSAVPAQGMESFRAGQKDIKKLPGYLAGKGAAAKAWAAQNLEQASRRWQQATTWAQRNLTREQARLFLSNYADQLKMCATGNCTRAEWAQLGKNSAKVAGALAVTAGVSLATLWAGGTVAEATGRGIKRGVGA